MKNIICTDEDLLVGSWKEGTIYKEGRGWVIRRILVIGISNEAEYRKMMSELGLLHTVNIPFKNYYEVDEAEV